MKIGLTSETLIFSGTFLSYAGQEFLGIAMIVFGVLGGAISFLHFVSRASNADNQKTILYNDLRKMFSLINHIIGSMGEYLDKKSKDDTVLH